MDYREVLKIYMRHVLDEESITFLEYCRLPENVSGEVTTALKEIHHEVVAEKKAEYQRWLSEQPARRRGRFPPHDPRGTYWEACHRPQHVDGPCAHAHV